MLTQASRLFIVFVMLLGFAQIDAEEIPNGINMPHYKRQVAGTGNQQSTPADSTSSKSSPDNGPTPSSSDSNNNGPSSTKTPSTNDNQQTSKDNGPSSTVGPKSTSVVHTTKIPTTIEVTTTNADGSKVTTKVSTDKVAKTTEKVKNSFVTGDGTVINAATLTAKTVIKSPLVSSKTIHSTYTSYFTSDGVRQSTVITTDIVVPTTTGFTQTTVNPSLADGGGSGSGLSGNTKAVVGGVVGGIGGAALVGGIVFVLLRIYRTKKQDNRYSDYSEKYSSNRESTMTYGTYGTGSEGYSSYGGRVNTASNF